MTLYGLRAEHTDGLPRRAHSDEPTQTSPLSRAHSAEPTQHLSKERNDMSRLIKCLGIPALAVALLVVADNSKADAANGFALQVGGFGISTGHRGHDHARPSAQFSVQPSYQRTFQSSYRRTYQPSFQRSYPRPVRQPTYHNTTHLDYHAPQLVPHNGHLDYVPGHYDVHRTGHWHH
jgi:hypothetical protein